MPPAPVPAPVSPPAPRPLVVRGYADSSNGYGRMMGYLIRGLETLGQPVILDPIFRDESRVPLDPFLVQRCRSVPMTTPALWMNCPGHPTPDSALLTMWESSRLDPGHAAAMATARVVITPSRWGAGCFQLSGVKPPIRVVPLGVDTSRFYPEPDLSRKTGFTVLTVARTAHGGARKGVDELIAAFVEALGDRPDARLHVKIWPDCQVHAAPHPRVILDRSSYDDDGLRRLYSSASVYASMSKGEGWGMPILEAMACGTPYVGPLHTAVAEFADPTCAYPVDWRPEPGRTQYYEGRGDWYVPSHASMVNQLRAAYADPAGRRARGQAAAAQGRAFSWTRSAVALRNVLREFDLAA